MTTFLDLRARLDRLLDASITPTDPALADFLRRSAAPCLALAPTRSGFSQLGGDPWLPDEVEWPRTESGVHLNFLAQLDCAELAAAAGDEQLSLPKHGSIYVFVEAITSAADPVPLRCVYNASNSNRRRRVLPAGTPLSEQEMLLDLAPCHVRPVPSLSLPVTTREASRRIGRPRPGDLTVEIDDIQRALTRNDALGQVFGWANEHDAGDMYRQVQLERLGRDDLIYDDWWDTMEDYEASCREHPGIYEHKRKNVEWLIAHSAEIARGAASWQMFLRVDSSDRLNLSINDADPLFVFVPRVELADGKVGRAVGRVLQG